MSLTPVAAEGEDEPDEEPALIPVRQVKTGECFGASGLMPGDNYRRDTATAVGKVTLKVIPHNHFKVMLRDDQFLKAGLQANDTLHAKKMLAGQFGREGNDLIANEIYDELEDEDGDCVGSSASPLDMNEVSSGSDGSVGVTARGRSRLSQAEASASRSEMRQVGSAQSRPSMR